MPSSTSPNMGLFLPVPGSTLGPGWATELTANQTTVDTHDHTPGKGVAIPIAALTINANFSWLGFGQTNIGYAAFIDKLLTANLTVNGSLGNVLGLPYWRDGAGVVSQLLSASALGTATFSAAQITSGTLAAARLPAFAGDVTATAGGGALTIASTNLQQIIGLTGAADRVPYFTGVGAMTLAAFTSNGRAIVATATPAAARTALGITDAYVVVDDTTIAAASTYTSPSWSVAAYSKITLIVELSSLVAQPTFTLVGLASGTYSCQLIVGNSTTLAGSQSLTTWTTGIAIGSGVNLNFEILIRKGFQRSITGFIANPAGANNNGMIIGSVSNTSDDVTGIAIDFHGAATGSIRVVGWP